MKKYLILTFIAVLCLTTAQAQQYTEAVYLKNGSVIRGTVIEQVPGESLKIRTADGSIFVYRMDEVVKITKTNESADKSRNAVSRGRKIGGYIDLGYVQNARSGGSGLSRFELLSSYGYHPTQYFYVGGGLGASYFYDVNEFFLPILANVKGTLPLSRKISAFADCKIGYAFSLNNSENDGFYLSPSLGINLDRLYFSVGYVAQYIYLWDLDYNFNIGGVSFRVGIKF